MQQYYHISDVDTILSNFTEDKLKVTKSKGLYYYELAASFDIEVSSFYIGNKKQAIMYIWTFDLEGYIIIGRKWSEFNELCDKLVEHFSLCDECRLVIYVHNLGYEFQFMKNRFEWLKVFSLKQREPVQAITNDGIEFRCSYLLSGYSLEKLSTQLTKYKVSKKVGDLDVATRVSVQIQLTSDIVSYVDKVVKQCEKNSFYDAFEIGVIWLERELAKSK